MIIQALNDYYLRLSEQEKAVPPFGFSFEKIHFALVLGNSGKLIDVKDLREIDGKKAVPRVLMVPAPNKKSSGIDPNFLWGNTGYVLGFDNKEHKDKNRLKKMFESFRKLQNKLGKGIDYKGIDVVLKFLDSWEIKNTNTLKYHDEIAGMNVVFQMDGERNFIHDHYLITNRWKEYKKGRQSNYEAACLVCGEKKPIARLHQSIKGVKDAQSSGASLVSFNLDSFCSYNKNQSFNSPVSEEITFNYTTALNYLLRFDSRQKIQIGDATTVFWAEGSNPVEGFLKDILDPGSNESNVSDLRRFLEAASQGRMPREIEDSKNMKFYILGLSPNASRISVRFWHVSSVREIILRIGQHFKDMKIKENYENDPLFPGIWQLLKETAVQGKTDNISPQLAGSLTRSILTGNRYPSRLLATILGRIKADQKINYLRASMIKAYLARNIRFNTGNESEVIKMSLNADERNIGYRLGRLFAVLEKAQKDAVPGANSTIKDRYYGSASSTPASVFPQLLRLTQHHIRKSEYGANIEKHIENIVRDIQKFPSHLIIEDQGMFALGYYHQKQEFYKKIKKEEE
jgi:CRISPR-associated protein Csd1